MCTRMHTITLAQHYAQSSWQLWVDEHVMPQTDETRFSDKSSTISMFY